MEKLIKTINGLSGGCEVYGVGGFARDLLLKRKHEDIDLAVNKNAQKFSKKLAVSLKAKFVILDDKNKIYRIMLSKDYPVKNIDVSLFDGKTINEDLKNRDFTINAAAFKLKDFASYKKNLLTVNNKVLKDLKTKTIRAVSDNIFKSDPLRMLRAFRFSAELKFALSKDTLSLIKKYSSSVLNSAPERIKNEFFRILSAGNSREILEVMDKCLLLPALFDAISHMKKASKKHYYHPGGLFEHSFETMSAAENILNNLRKYFPENAAELKEHFFKTGEYSENITRANLLKFAALFHDSAKPETAKKEGAKMRFFGHEDLGAKKISDVMKSLKMGKKEISAASFLVSKHMRPSTLTKNNIVTKKASLKFFRDIEDNTPDLLILSMADWHSYKKLKIHSKKELKFQEDSVRKLLKEFYELKNKKPLSKIIDGHIVMKKFALKPGPWIGDLVNLVLEKQYEGKLADTAAALKFLDSKLTQIKKKYKL
ncbi:HD domain-containing protein [Endomicrobium proavitum]|uniref:CCA-adding tRNA nucleotidyltransferase n=1 Tax=Endomicrobium proavitum TaxID=1408281 RepID=A0A0G3WHZ9_9BACT|nr:HD domain-containing protein [Endomicrobium proavitum]AKL97500.1 CCA-adding tRNA nucleotidyltransferase [Endomicrobium proavitum]